LEAFYFIVFYLAVIKLKPNVKMMLEVFIVIWQIFLYNEIESSRTESQPFSSFIIGGQH